MIHTKLALVGVLALGLSAWGCGKPAAEPAPKATAASHDHEGHDHAGHDHGHEGHDHAGHDHAKAGAGHDHSGWWCPEHAVPEEEIVPQAAATVMPEPAVVEHLPVAEPEMVKEECLAPLEILPVEVPQTVGIIVEFILIEDAEFGFLLKMICVLKSLLISYPQISILESELRAPCQISVPQPDEQAGRLKD